MDPALFIRCFVKVANLSVDLIASDVSEAPLCNSQTKVQVDGYGFSFLQDTSIQIDVISNIIYNYAATETIDIYKLSIYITVNRLRAYMLVEYQLCIMFQLQSR